MFYSALFETLWEGFSSHPAQHPCCLCAFKPDLAFRRSLGDAESIDIRIYLASPANDEQHNDYTMLIHVDYDTCYIYNSSLWNVLNYLPSICQLDLLDPLNHLAREIIRILHDLHLLLEQQLSMALDTSFSERVATAACLIALSHVQTFQRFYSIPMSPKSSSILCSELLHAGGHVRRHWCGLRSAGGVDSAVPALIPLDLSSVLMQWT